MAVEQTLSIIKPDGVQKNLIGEIYSRFEKAGLKIVATRMMHLTQEQAGGFYAVHKERPFYNDLVAYMTSGPVVVQVLSGEDAVVKNRDIMGATNPADAAPGTIRKDFAESIEENIAHYNLYDIPKETRRKMKIYKSKRDHNGDLMTHKDMKLEKRGLF